MNEDLRPELYFNPSADMHFTECTSCNLNNVLRVGDYCRACAAIWRVGTNVSDNEFLVVTADTIDPAAESSLLPRNYLAAKARKALLHNQYYVIFYARGEWDEILVHKKFHLNTIMRNLFEALGDH